MKGSKKRYDNKHKVTRILLADYLFLKGLAKMTGNSMAQELHKLILKEAEPEPEPTHPAQIPMPVTMARSIPVAFRVKSPVALRVRPEPVLTTNGHKAGVFVTKPKGGIIND
ncbi:unnamed protein product [marine sediment metagenome]|uniref:Uncharacterized protein n=1 Tax=marine sediment metagenome TaxID=412755 RepID=X1LX28_9ZZZZ